MKLHRALLGNFIFVCMLSAAIASADTPELPVRSTQYIDDTWDDYLSGWKGMLTNAFPDRILASGQWFSPSPTPKPFSEGKIKPFPDALKERLRANSTDAVLVVQNNQIVGSYFRYGFGIDHIHSTHSTGKAYTSFACQPYYDRIGNEGLDKTLETYLPKLKGTAMGGATLAQALDMTSATEWSENYEDPNSASMVSGAVGGWDPLEPGEEPRSWYTMLDQPSIGEHGKMYSYSSATIVSASFACETIAGKHFSELVQDSYNLLGFEDRSYYVSNLLTELSAEGGQAISIRDFVKLGRYMLETKNSQYVDDVWNMDDAVSRYMPKDKYSFAKGYKNYWYRLGDDVILALGSSGQFLYIDRSKSLIIAKFSSFVKGQGAAEFGIGFELLEEIAATH